MSIGSLAIDADVIEEHVQDVPLEPLEHHVRQPTPQTGQVLDTERAPQELELAVLAHKRCLRRIVWVDLDLVVGR
eukprot:55948-Eustigmatos_ZCMA.PRE.2